MVNSTACILGIRAMVFTSIILIGGANIGVQLYHHPGCIFSSSFLQSYVSLPHSNHETIDCSRAPEKCQHITKYPTLVQLVTKNKDKIHQDNRETHQATVPSQTTTINQILYLEKFNINTDPAVKTASLIVDALQRQPNFAVIIFEQLGLPVQDRLDHPLVFYLEPASNTTQRLLPLVNQRTGCWIFQAQSQQFKDARPLNRYSCGTGSSARELTKAIDLFQKGKLQEATLTNDQIPDGQVNTEGLLRLLSADSFCGGVLFMSQRCPYCKKNLLIRAVEAALKSIRNVSPSNWFYLTVFELSKNSLPKQVKPLKHIPTLRVYCRGLQEEISPVTARAALRVLKKAASHRFGWTEMKQVEGYQM